MIFCNSGAQKRRLKGGGISMRQTLKTIALLSLLASPAALACGEGKAKMTKEDPPWTQQQASLSQRKGLPKTELTQVDTALSNDLKDRKPAAIPEI
jgi:hypothetical protein